MITTVIFDLDDTLYDEIEYCKSGFAAVAKYLSDHPCGHPAEHISNIIWKHFTASNHTKTFNTALDEHEIDYDDEFINDLVRIYRDHIPNIKLPQDSRDVLDRLSIKYTLLTDGFLPAQRLKVQAIRADVPRAHSLVYRHVWQAAAYTA